METLTLDQVSGLLGDLVGAVTNGNNSTMGDPNVFATVVLDQFFEVRRDPGFIA